MRSEPSRSLELAVHAEVVGHIRRAREAGESWAAVGEMLGFGPIAAEGPGTLAELGFDYAAGPRTIDPWFPAPPMFVWDCPGCGQRIADHGPGQGAGLRSGRPQGRLRPAGRRSRRLGAGGPAMNGPQHFRQAEKLLEHAASMLDTDVAPEARAELVQRQAASPAWPPRTRCSRPRPRSASAHTWTGPTN